MSYIKITYIYLLKNKMLNLIKFDLINFNLYLSNFKIKSIICIIKFSKYKFKSNKLNLILLKILFFNKFIDFNFINYSNNWINIFMFFLKKYDKLKYYFILKFYIIKDKKILNLISSKDLNIYTNL